jgi:hypothetical protein
MNIKELKFPVEIRPILGSFPLVMEFLALSSKDWDISGRSERILS